MNSCYFKPGYLATFLSFFPNTIPRTCGRLILESRSNLAGYRTSRIATVTDAICEAIKDNNLIIISNTLMHESIASKLPLSLIIPTIIALTKPICEIVYFYDIQD